jgi:hypothetical protein
MQWRLSAYFVNGELMKTTASLIASLVFLWNIFVLPETATAGEKTGMMIVLNTSAPAVIKSTERIAIAGMVSGDAGPFGYHWCYCSGTDTTWNTDTTKSSWVINSTYAAVFTPGSTVTVLLRVTSNSSGAESYATRSFIVNAPPSGGTFQVSPSGGMALSTTFQLTASGWTDDYASTIYYRFGYYNGATKVALTSTTTSNIYSTTLPLGSLPGNQMDIFVDMSDNLSEFTEKVQRITVSTTGVLDISLTGWPSLPFKVFTDSGFSAQASVTGTSGPFSYFWYYVTGGDTIRRSDTTSAIWAVNGTGASAFVRGELLTIGVTVRSQSTGLISSTTLAYRISGAPHGGTLTVSPTVGTAESTWFDIAASGWIDDSPETLRYQFGYYDESGSKVSLTSSGTSASARKQMPAGPLSDGGLRVYVDVNDNEGYTAHAEQIVTVNPFLLPVELQMFTAGAHSGAVHLAWRTATETNNYGFDVERRSSRECNWTKIGFVQGGGTTAASRTYSFVDKPAAGTCSYRLKQIDRDGKYSHSNPVDVFTASAPDKITLEQNYPNPFNPVTTIHFQLPAASHVRLAVYDLLGREVGILVDGDQPEGWYAVPFDASHLPSGVYICRMSAGGYESAVRMMLEK